VKPTEAAALLTIAAAYDNRKPDADQAKAWAMALDGHRFEDCRDAIVAHYRKSRDWLMPSDVIGGVRRLRDKRLDDFGPILPPARYADDPTAELAWTRRAVTLIGDGTVTDPAQFDDRGELTRRDVAALGMVGQEVPDA
jgi:hypothetical protein